MVFSAGFTKEADEREEEPSSSVGPRKMRIMMSLESGTNICTLIEDSPSNPKEDLHTNRSATF